MIHITEEFRKSVLLPPGRYYFGDPCYIFSHDGKGVLNDDAWSAVCDVLDHEEKSRLQELTFHGDICQKCYLTATAYGDGCYEVGLGDSTGIAGVDAGLLAIITPGLMCLAGRAENIDMYVHLNLKVPTTITVKNSDWYANRKLFCRTSDL